MKEAGILYEAIKQIHTPLPLLICMLCSQSVLWLRPSSKAC